MAKAEHAIHWTTRNVGQCPTWSPPALNRVATYIQQGGHHVGHWRTVLVCHFFVCHFVCTVTDFSVAETNRGVKFCMSVGLLSGQVFSPLVKFGRGVGKSTESALHQLVGRTEKALDSREYSLGVFFDTEGAFNNTSCKSIRLALDEWKVHRSTCNWIITMLAHRTILAKAETFIIMVTASCGLPQGGGLSPILRSLVANSLLKWLSKQGVFAQGYADDGAVLICARILSTITHSHGSARVL